MNIKPLADRVLVKPAQAEEKVGGIIIPDTAKEKPLHGKVVAVGNGTKDEQMILKEGDSISIRDRENSKAFSSRFMDTAEGRGIVAWLALDKTQHEGKVLRVPTREEMAPVVNEQLVVELYSK